MHKILVIGAAGQIGSELTVELRKCYGNENVFASDLNNLRDDIALTGPFVKMDVMDSTKLADFIRDNKISVVYHLAAMLSAKAEQNPHDAWKLNMQSLLYILEMCREGIISKLFWPSSIAVFGPTTPKINTPQITVTEPTTVYGISKLAGERWCEYYYKKYRVDVRSIRYPGLISYKTKAGGGTTDYAVEIFYHAVKNKHYECFLESDTRLPMMFMPDAIRGTIELMEADPQKVKIRSSYNLSAFSFTPAELAEQISSRLPDFKITYKPDFRQKIAESWPESISDIQARQDWGWEHKYEIPEMTEVMLKEIALTLQLER